MKDAVSFDIVRFVHRSAKITRLNPLIVCHSKLLDDRITLLEISILEKFYYIGFQTNRKNTLSKDHVSICKMFSFFNNFTMTKPVDLLLLLIMKFNFIDCNVSCGLLKYEKSFCSVLRCSTFRKITLSPIKLNT